MLDIFGRTVSLGDDLAFRDDNKWFKTRPTFIGVDVIVLQNLKTGGEIVSNPKDTWRYMLMQRWKDTWRYMLMQRWAAK